MKATYEAVSRPEQQKTAFLEQLVNVQDQLHEKGIDYRIIGSLASHAFLSDAPTTGIPPLSYDRPGAATRDQRVPDVDLIVPRADLPAAREVRQNLIESSFPVKLGLANPTTEIDFRPDEDESFLTHKNLALPVSNEVFQAETASLEGVKIRTIPLDSLVHTFGTFGGKIRHKDIALLGALIRHDTQPIDAEKTNVFHDFQRQRRRLSPGQYRFSRGLELVERRMPRRVKNEMYRVALKAADVLGKR